MIEILKKLLSVVPIEEIKDKEVLILKGLYKIPISIGDIKNQIKFNQ
jgi:hypothetical protein